MSVTIESDLKEVLDQINQKLNKIDERLNKLEIGQARLEGDLSAIKEDVKDLKGSQKAQIWTLIGILGTALVGTIIRYIIIPLPTSNP
ncbi:MAG: hemolysin XhlA family protein [Xenococcaceae cyanobacterium]